MQVNYTKLLIVEGLIRQVQIEENRCILTLKNVDRLQDLRQLLDRTLTYFEEGDAYEGVEEINQEEKERSIAVADKILDEIQRLSWGN